MGHVAKSPLLFRKTRNLVTPAKQAKSRPFFLVCTRNIFHPNNARILLQYYQKFLFINLFYYTELLSTVCEAAEASEATGAKEDAGASETTGASKAQETSGASEASGTLLSAQEQSNQNRSYSIRKGQQCLKKNVFWGHNKFYFL